VLGANGEAEIAEEQRLDPSAEGVERAARCRAAFPDPAAKARAWEFVTRDDRASGRIISATAEGFWYPEHAELCAPYVERYFAELPSVAATRTVNLVQPAAIHLFPRYAIEPATLAFADAMLARPDLHPVLRRLAGDATDDLRRALAIRARYG
jgi:aminopeptidase N